MNRDAAFYAEKPFHRFSATRLAVYLRCPLAYGHQYREWCPTPTIPVMRVGKAVQRAFERVLRLPASSDIQSLADLHERANGRLMALTAAAMRDMEAVHDADPGSIDAWTFTEERAQQWAEAALAEHMTFVEPWDDALGHANPALAWAKARPEMMPGREMHVLADGWFQWAQDLTYATPDGRRVVADLKIGSGRGGFAEDNYRQMRLYGWAETASGRAVDRLVLWYLGRRDGVSVEVDPRPDLAASDVALMKSILRADEAGKELARNPEADCASCAFRFGCQMADGGPCGPEPETSFEKIERDGGSGPWTVEAVVGGIGEEREARGRMKRRVTLMNRTGVRSYKFDARDVDRLGLRAGQWVRLEGLRSWSGQHVGVQLDVGRETTVELLEQESIR